MTAADLDGFAPAARSTPVASVSQSAILANARLLDLATGSLIGLPADAYGHGFDATAGTLVAAGFAVTDADVVWSEADALLGLAPGFSPAMRLTGTVLGVKPLRRGEGVSYGYTHRAIADTSIALVVGGYAQGVVRALGNRASVTIRGRRLPIVGRVAMDVCVVDVSDVAVARGDEVVFFGDPAAGEPSVAEWASATGLGELEIVTCVGLGATREQQP